jgi:hypothetical protein
MTAAMRPRRDRKRSVIRSSRQQPIDAPSAWPDGNEHGAGPADKRLQCQAEPGTAEDRDEEPRRVVPFAVDHVHHRDDRQRDAKDVRVEDVADHLGRLHQLRPIGIDLIESFSSGGVQTA